MKKIPESHLALERRLEVEKAKEILSGWIAALLRGYGGDFAQSRVAYWDDYIKRREKEMEDETKA